MSATNTFLKLAPYISLAISSIAIVYESRKAGKDWGDTLADVLTFLKNREVMTASGYAPELVDQITEFSVAVESSAASKAKVEEVLHAPATTGTGLKVGSLNGKPIYLENVLGVGSALAGVIGAFRK